MGKPDDILAALGKSRHRDTGFWGFGVLGLLGFGDLRFRVLGVCRCLENLRGIQNPMLGVDFISPPKYV